MSRDLGRDVPDLEKLYARKLWADFSYPIFDPVLGQFSDFSAIVPQLARWGQNPFFGHFFPHFRPEARNGVFTRMKLWAFLAKKS